MSNIIPKIQVQLLKNAATDLSEDLRRNEVGVEGASGLAPALKQLTALQHLDLCRNELCAEAATALAPALRQLIALQHLDLCRNELYAEGASALAPALKQPTKPLAKRL